MTKVRYETAEAAENGFYAALREGDLETMEALWEQSATVICVHPAWPALRGHAEIIASWRRIFLNQPSLHIRHQLLETIQDANTCLRIGKEIFAAPNKPNGPPPAVVTNVYRLTSRGWKMVLHHASPIPWGPDKAADERPLLH